MLGVVLAVVVTPLPSRALAGCASDLDCGFNACLASNFCGADGLCQPTPKNCDDGDPCTLDDCNPLGVGCTHAPLCPDEDTLVCDGTQACLIVTVPGTGFRFGTCHHVSKSCDDGDACTVDSCAEPTGCRHTTLDCDDGDPCTTDTCAPATGCDHAGVPGCCRTAADCGTDACTIRLCASGTCAPGMPVSCSDGDPGTIDACDPGSGCTHTPVKTVTTTTAPGAPSAQCETDADCPDPGDACTAPVCDDAHRCGARPLTGFDALACICRRAEPAACDGQPVPKGVLRRRAHACAAIGRAATAGRRKGRRLVGRVGHLLAAAERGLSSTKKVSPECVQAETALLADGAARAATVRQQL
jgi:hypothetical protein